MLVFMYFSNELKHSLLEAMTEFKNKTFLCHYNLRSSSRGAATNGLKGSSLEGAGRVQVSSELKVARLWRVPAEVDTFFRSS